VADSPNSKPTREEIIEHLELNRAAERLSVIMARFRHSGVDSEDVKALKRGILALRSYGSIDEVRRKLTNKVIEDIAEQGYKEHGWRERIRAIIVNTLCGPRPELTERQILQAAAEAAPVQETDASPRRITNGA
jgi:septum formation topological specificity factor MinE